MPQRRSLPANEADPAGSIPMKSWVVAAAATAEAEEARRGLGSLDRGLDRLLLVALSVLLNDIGVSLIARVAERSSSPLIRSFGNQEVRKGVPISN